MTINACKDEIINFVMNSSDADNLIIATFIAGMQAKKGTFAGSCYKKDDNYPQQTSAKRSINM